MKIVDPLHLLWGRLDVSQLEIDDDGFLTAAAQHARQRFVVAGIDLLMRHEWGHVDEIARTRLRDVLEAITPAHAGASAHDVDHALDRPVMMGAGLRVRVDDYCPRPQLFCARSSVGNRGSTGHAYGLRRVAVEFIRVHDAHAMVAPIGVVAHRREPYSHDVPAGTFLTGRQFDVTCTSTQARAAEEATNGLEGA